ncbi:MAG TPA: alpha/beta fold hydrolase [Pseudonocardia sp.]|jgi:pimeloyl-ACP methyl ester carboxylesterase
MSTAPAIQETVVETWGGRVRLRVKVSGTGPPLIYLHPLGGLMWDPFLTRLAHTHTVYAPELPGTSTADAFAIHQIDDVFDLVLAYEEALRSLAITGAPVIGQSFGGMLAAELAACFPDHVTQLVLLAPAGLWLEHHPWSLELLTGPPDNLPGFLFADPDSAPARAMLAMPTDPGEALEAQVQLIWAMGCGAKFLWPIPDRGLAKRLHRITADTLIIWGEQDHAIPVAYAHEFAARITNSHVEILPHCGHIPQIEQPDTTHTLITKFLNPK